MALDFFYQPVRVSVRFTQNYLENRVLTHCGLRFWSIETDFLVGDQRISFRQSIPI